MICKMKAMSTKKTNQKNLNTDILLKEHQNNFNLLTTTIKILRQWDYNGN